VSVIDAAGNAAAISMSNGEGNGFIVGDFGFMLNNMLGEEDLASGSLEAWREGTRLSSMMAPTLILEPDGTITALGTGGSNRIRSAILQVATNLLARGMSLEEAVEAPRLHVERDGTVSFEPGLPEEASSAFRALGEKGEYRLRDFKYVVPPKEEVKTSMEALIHHFKIVAHGFFPPVGEAYQAIEAPKGELGFYIVSNGKANPYRYHVRAPSFINLTILEKMCVGSKVADAVVNLGSIDIVLGEVDR